MLYICKINTNLYNKEVDMASASPVARRVVEGRPSRWTAAGPTRSVLPPVLKRRIYFGESNGPPSPGASPEELSNIGSSSPPGKKERASKGATPPGNGSGAGDAKDLNNHKDTTSHSSNTWTTIKLLIGTALSGLGSFTAHFTNIFGEGTAKNLAQIGFDFLTTLGFALTGASALSTYGTDKTHINTTSIN